MQYCVNKYLSHLVICFIRLSPKIDIYSDSSSYTNEAKKQLGGPISIVQQVCLSCYLGIAKKTLYIFSYMKRWSKSAYLQAYLHRLVIYTTVHPLSASQ